MTSPPAYPDGAVVIDGARFAPGEARIATLDHGFLYGDGVFETLRVYEGHAFRLEAHLARLHAALLEVGIASAPAPSVLAAQVRHTLEVVGLGEATCRITVTRGIGRGLEPSRCGYPTVVIAVLPLEPLPDSAYRVGRSAVILWPRATADRPPPWVNSTSYQRAVLARLELARASADEGFYLDETGHVTEAVTANLFLVERGAIVTPPPRVCLHGITRAEVLSLVAEPGIVVSEEPVSVERLSNADEVFVTSSLAELVPITRFAGAPVGDGVPGPVHRELLDRYRARVRASVRDNDERTP